MDEGRSDAVDFYKPRNLTRKLSRKRSGQFASTDSSSNDGVGTLARPPRRASQKFLEKIASQVQLEVHNAETLRSHGRRKSAYVPSEVMMLPSGRSVEVSEDREELWWVHRVAQRPCCALTVFTLVPILMGVVVAVTAADKINLVRTTPFLCVQ